MAEPRVLQGTPSGYLVDFGDGIPRLVPPGVVERSGLAQPGNLAPPQPEGPGLPGAAEGLQYGPGMVQPPDPMAGAAPLDPYGAPPMPEQAPPAPGPLPGSAQSDAHRGGFSTSSKSYLDQTPPPPVDYDPILDRQSDSIAYISQSGQRQKQHLTNSAAQSKLADEAEFGQYDAEGNLVKPGTTQDESARLKKEADDLAPFIAAKTEAVERKVTDINQRLANIPSEDPARLWSSGNAFTVASGLFAAMAGGMLAVSTGSGRNLGLEAIERAIDRDIAAQRADIENTWKRIGLDREDLAIMREELRLKEAEQKAYMLESIKLDNAAKIGRFESGAKQAEMMAQIAALDQATEKAVGDALKNWTETYTAKSNAEYERWRTTKEFSLREDANKIDWYNARSQRMAAAARGKEDKPTGPIPLHDTPGGTRVYIDPAYTANMTDEQIGKMREGYAKQADFIQSLTEYRDAVAEVGRKYAGVGSNTAWGNTEVKTVKDMAARLSAKAAYQLSGTQYSEPFRQAVQGWIGQTAGWTGINPVQSQGQYIEELMNTMETEMAGRGAIILRPNEEVPGTIMATRPDFRAMYGSELPAGTQSDAAAATEDLGRVALTSTDPDKITNALVALENTAASPLAVGKALMSYALKSPKVKAAGGKNTTEYTQPDYRSDPAATVQLLKANAARAKAKAGPPAKWGDKKRRAFLELDAQIERIEKVLTGANQAAPAVGPGIDVVAPGVGSGGAGIR